MCAHLSSGQDAEGRPELLTSFFELCHRTLVFAPGLLLSLPSADALFDAAIGCVTHQEFTHTRAALTFVCLFIAGTESAGPYRETSACCLQKSGARLLEFFFFFAIFALGSPLIDSITSEWLLEATPWLRTPGAR